MYEFHRNAEGESTEGYLGNPEKFNGIVFLLREPNNSDKEKQEFWFKKVLYDLEGYCQEQKEKGNSTVTTKRAATKYKNRFNEMIEYVRKKDDLKNAVYCNIHPECGETYKTKQVSEAIKKGIPEEMLMFFSTLKSDIIVFTCRDIYSSLLDSKKIRIKKQGKGLVYKKKELSCFECEVGNAKIIVYEIFHPSYSGRIINKTTSP